MKARALIAAAGIALVVGFAWTNDLVGVVATSILTIGAITYSWVISE